MALNDALTNRQTNARAWNFFPVKTLENAENAFVILRRDTDSVVLNREEKLAIVIRYCQMHPQRVASAILNRVGNQVLHQEDQRAVVDPHLRQGIVRDY